MSGDDSDGDESVTGTAGQDASSTATIGSNLLYLSDEQVNLVITRVILIIIITNTGF